MSNCHVLPSLNKVITASCLSILHIVIALINFGHFVHTFLLISALRENHVKFGDCAIGVPKQLSFTLTNHSSTDLVRFSWTPPPEITLSPCIGHLNPGCAKDIVITFTSAKPKTINGQNVPCKVTKIKVGDNEDKVSILNYYSHGLYPHYAG